MQQFIDLRHLPASLCPFPALYQPVNFIQKENRLPRLRFRKGTSDILLCFSDELG